MNSEDVAQLRMALGRIARLIDRQTRQGMTRTELTTLLTVALRGPLTMGSLADIEGINPTMLSRIVAKLEDAGLVTRSSDTVDGRVVHVRATAKGRRLQERVAKERTDLLAARLAELDPEVTQRLLAVVPDLELLGEQLHLDTAAGNAGAAERQLARR